MKYLYAQTKKSSQKKKIARKKTPKKKTKINIKGKDTTAIQLLTSNELKLCIFFDSIEADP